MGVTAPEAAASTIDGAGRPARWFSRDPVSAAAFGLIVLAVAVRAWVASRGFLIFDDFMLASRAMESQLSLDHLLMAVNEHVMPAGLLIIWLVTRAFGLAHWPYVVLLTIGYAVLGVAFYRLLRSALRPGWGQLVPLGLLLYSPLTLEATSMALTGLTVLPMMVAMVLAIGAQVRYVRTRRVRHLVTLGLSVLFGLLFFEKSLLIAPLIFLLTVFLFTTGGPLRGPLEAARRFGPAWLVLTAVSVGYLALYTSIVSSSVRQPTSIGTVLTFWRQLIGHTLLPGLFGGPWQWLPSGDVAPLAAPGEVPRWLAWMAPVAVVVITVRARPTAIRAWLLLLAYVLIVCGLFTLTRLSTDFAPWVGLAPRYVCDTLVVAAFCLGVAFMGLADTADRQSVAPEDPHPATPARRSLALPRGHVATAVVVVLAGLLLSAAWSTIRFGDLWAVKNGRAFLRTAEAELARAPAGTVFLDRSVPETVQASFFHPYHLYSRFFLPAGRQPKIVDEAENPSVFDDSGRIRPAWVQGANIRPGADPWCKTHKIVGGGAVRLPLDSPVLTRRWVVRIGYLSGGGGQSTAVLRLGDGTRSFTVQPGLHQIFFVLDGGGDAVELTIKDSGVWLCTNEITVGQAVPWP
jgi:hypothetical protein